MTVSQDCLGQMEKEEFFNPPPRPKNTKRQFLSHFAGKIPKMRSPQIHIQKCIFSDSFPSILQPTLQPPVYCACWQSEAKIPPPLSNDRRGGRWT